MASKTCSSADRVFGVAHRGGDPGNRLSAAESGLVLLCRLPLGSGETELGVTLEAGPGEAVLRDIAAETGRGGYEGRWAASCA